MDNVITPPNFSAPAVTAFFTTRHFHKDSKHIKGFLAEICGLRQEQIFLPIQKHTNEVHNLQDSSEPVIADAVITDKRNLLIGVLVADCVPLLVHDTVRKIMGAVHAGWRGTASGILMKTVTAMREKYGSLPRDLVLAIGPSIRQCSYEVDEEVRNAVSAATGPGSYYKKRGEKYLLDLASANRIQAVKAGIPEGSIWRSDECTYCNPDKFYSYRYARETGRQGGFIGMW
ncbi:MAG: peptidoglycan editing factor PgeF [Nitrospiraceae bacterium]|nr:MAG: peptidoglycan editing factor PgeF [Nitrospiraceae bacterium]